MNSLVLPDIRTAYADALQKQRLQEALKAGILRQEDLATDLQSACEYGRKMVAELHGNNRLTDQQKLKYLQLIQSININPGQINRIHGVSDLNNWELAARIIGIPGSFLRHPKASTATAIITVFLIFAVLMLMGWASVSLFSPTSNRRETIQMPIGGSR